jgi:hypothetical protein
VSFNVKALPPKVQEAFNNKNIDRNVLYWTARWNGISNENELADILFYHAHKELLLPFGFGSVPLKPGMPNYNALAAEWKKFQQLARSLRNAIPDFATKMKQEGDANQENDNLSEILRDIDVRKFLHTEWDRKEFDTFIKLILCELNGIQVDCNYMVFTTKTTKGQEARDYEQVAFISKHYDENVIARLKRHFNRASTAEMQRETHRIYRNLCNSIDEIKKWNNFNAGLADADYSKTDGARYTNEIVRRMCNSRPPSIYFAVGKRMQIDEEKTGIFKRRLRYHFVLPTTVLLPGAIKGIY